MLIVGGGPGGLACAIRLGQLLEENPDVRERLGDVPVAVLEKGKQPGSHLVSGAVVNPRPLRELFRGRLTMADMPTYGQVPGEAVYVMTRRSAVRIPAPPTMRNHGNHILSAASSAAFSGTGRGARRRRPAGDGRDEAPRPARPRGRRPHRGQGARPARRAAPDLRAGLGHRRAGDRPRRGTQGLLTNAAIDHFHLQGENPQIWALGVKEVWRVPKPLDRIVHTLGWPLRTLGGYGEFGGSRKPNSP